MKNPEYDVVIVGSGASGGAVAYTLTKAGYKVAVLEKGRLLKRDEFTKDELAYCRRDIVTPNLFDEYLNLSFEEKIYMQHSTFGGSDDLTSIDYKDGYFLRNRHRATASTQLTRVFEDTIHVLSLSISYDKAGEERKTGYNEEKWHWSYKPVSEIYTQYARENMKDEYISGFKGAETAKKIQVTKKYILGINKKCFK